MAKRIDNPKNYWQMPQGGVNQRGFLAAAYRELEEETSITNVKLISELEGHTDTIYQIIYWELYGKENIEVKTKMVLNETFG